MHEHTQNRKSTFSGLNQHSWVCVGGGTQVLRCVGMCCSNGFVFFLILKHGFDSEDKSKVYQLNVRNNKKVRAKKIH